LDRLLNTFGEIIVVDFEEGLRNPRQWEANGFRVALVLEAENKLLCR
jgi:hypothetical protein